MFCHVPPPSTAAEIFVRIRRNARQAHFELEPLSEQHGRGGARLLLLGRQRRAAPGPGLGRAGQTGVHQPGPWQ
eukprot:scaffold2663_cov256-Pinguiococcus_pyrenoidosus.AAC.22